MNIQLMSSADHGSTGLTPDIDDAAAAWHQALEQRALHSSSISFLGTISASSSPGTHSRGRLQGGIASDIPALHTTT